MNLKKNWTTCVFDSFQENIYYRSFFKRFEQAIKKYANVVKDFIINEESITVSSLDNLRGLELVQLYKITWKHLENSFILKFLKSKTDKASIKSAILVERSYLTEIRVNFILHDNDNDEKIIQVEANYQRYQ